MSKVKVHTNLSRAALILETYQDRPEPLSVSATDEGLFLTLWCPGAPVTGLLAWGSLMEKADYKISPFSIEGHRTLNCVGVIDGVGCTVTVSTSAYVPADASGAISPDDLDTIAKREFPLW